MKKLPPSHDKIQQEIFIYLWNTYPETRRTFWHTPNEISQDYYLEMKIKEMYLNQKRSVPAVMLQLFAECKKRFVMLLSRRSSIGVLPGVTDLVWYWKGTLYAFDIKIGSDKISEAQHKFINAIEKQGGKFFEINSIEQAKQIIDDIINCHPNVMK